MADSPVFDFVCAELEARSEMDRLASRGTVRIGLREAGLDAAGVDASQMAIVLRRVLPAELDRRGVAGATTLCESIAAALAGRRFEAVADRAGRAAETLARLGS